MQRQRKAGKRTPRYRKKLAAKYLADAFDLINPARKIGRKRPIV